MSRLREITQKIGTDRLAILFVGGILLLVVCMPITNQKDLSKEQRITKSSQMQLLAGANERENDVQNNLMCSDNSFLDCNTYVTGLEMKLKKALQVVNGAGKVEVLITLQDAGSLVVEKDITYNRENDNKKGEEDISNTKSEDTEETIFITNEDGSEYPFVSKQILPKIEGILIVAQGADDFAVKKEIKEAVLSLFELDEHKIAIVKMKKTSKEAGL